MNIHPESLIVQEIFMKKIVLAFITVAVMCFGLSQAMAFKPAVVFDMGGKFDKSFNEGIWNGTEKFRKETGIKYREFEVQQEAQREQFLRKLRREARILSLQLDLPKHRLCKKLLRNFLTPNSASSTWLSIFQMSSPL